MTKIAKWLALLLLVALSGFTAYRASMASRVLHAGPAVEVDDGQSLLTDTGFCRAP